MSSALCCLCNIVEVNECCFCDIVEVNECCLCDIVEITECCLCDIVEITECCLCDIVAIDECTQGETACDQLCIDHVGYYECACKSGFQLAEDGKRCKRECLLMHISISSGTLMKMLQKMPILI